MKNIKIALIYCSESSSYRLVNFTKEINPNDPCVMWVFDSSKIKTAKKIMKNMTLADLNIFDLNTLL